MYLVWGTTFKSMPGTAPLPAERLKAPQHGTPPPGTFHTQGALTPPWQASIGIPRASTGDIHPQPHSRRTPTPRRTRVELPLIFKAFLLLPG